MSILLVSDYAGLGSAETLKPAETAALLRGNGTFQYLTGLPS
jgi:hypothetical protein